MNWVPLRRLAIVAGAAGAAYFAIEGGQYGTSDLIAQWRKKKAVSAEIDSLSRAVDSLAHYRRRLDTDAALQERIAREQFGMVRSDSELVYRFVEGAGGK